MYNLFFSPPILNEQTCKVLTKFGIELFVFKALYGGLILRAFLNKCIKTGNALYTMTVGCMLRLPHVERIPLYYCYYLNARMHRESGYLKFKQEGERITP